ncbi:hypothetical protein QBC38DRAFT_518377 [Podospora fimiseda]|uniref:Uncharacterized protein n=1 Tax=Podospora fimiseda TaxID=252190 RepID=A0AAN7BUW9_9PEZI|nr:hypothetical protein QBC38DRAFT_518377 [Podospora fimiseda]
MFSFIYILLAVIVRAEILTGKIDEPGEPSALLQHGNCSMDICAANGGYTTVVSDNGKWRAFPYGIPLIPKDFDGLTSPGAHGDPGRTWAYMAGVELWPIEDTGKIIFWNDQKKAEPHAWGCATFGNT